MQIKHKDGRILLVSIDCNASLTEAEIAYLLDPKEGQPHLRRCLEEARAFNREEKQKRIIELERKLKELKEGL